MANKKSKTDELLEALLDPRIVEALGRALSPIIAQTVQGAVQDAIGTINKRLDGLSACVEKLKNDFNFLSVRADHYEAENAKLRKIIRDNGDRLEEQEVYSRSCNLIIRGLPETTAAERATSSTGGQLHESYEAVENTVTAFLQDALHIDIKREDISVAHRLKKGARDAVRPVIVRFTTKKVRNLVYASKKALKGNPDKTLITEHLTKAASELFFKTRILQRDGKIFATWTQNGHLQTCHHY